MFVFEFARSVQLCQLSAPCDLEMLRGKTWLVFPRPRNCASSGGTTTTYHLLKQSWVFGIRTVSRQYYWRADGHVSPMWGARKLAIDIVEATCSWHPPLESDKVPELQLASPFSALQSTLVINRHITCIMGENLLRRRRQATCRCCCVSHSSPDGSSERSQQDCFGRT